METNDDDIIIVTRAMAEEALAEANKMIREGRWPEEYDGDDQVIFGDDGDDGDDCDDVPEPADALKAAE